MAFSLDKVTKHDPGQTFRDIRDANAKVLFRIGTDGLEQLESLVCEGTQSWHGTEVGGLVIGPRPTASDPVEKVTDFVRVEVNNPFAPIYQPGVADVKSFNEVLSRYPVDGTPARHPGVEGNFRAVGYFRSHFGEPQ